ncbi:hypothetical protein ACUXAV_002105 [Cupriavidus metallidurans]|jgi:hypothetical protein|uniref:hypothetical protein n=1 Tax=Cupriavidus TaxID=106589 RepID=UPI0004931C47|nr:hypothetical protein [Cupriavidus metallidurans]KWW35563.1 hypothetical protein AU374_03630 [Cupriavidus metallidurans]MDE4921702.1 hypothetical protein [Cupriavidus metallidurans]
MHEDDPFRIACCESCCSFRCRDDGWPICMLPMPDAAERAERDRALKGTNALNRCTRFVPLTDADKPTEGERHA